MSHYVVGYVLGGSLAFFELSCVLACTVFRRQTSQRFPRAYVHLVRGVKTTSYRLCAGVDTFLVTLFVTGNPWASSAVISFELVTKFGLYYVHETVWQSRPFRRFTSL